MSHWNDCFLTRGIFLNITSAVKVKILSAPRWCCRPKAGSIICIFCILAACQNETNNFFFRLEKTTFRPCQHPLMAGCWRVSSMPFLAPYGDKKYDFQAPPTAPVGGVLAGVIIAFFGSVRKQKRQLSDPANTLLSGCFFGSVQSWKIRLSDPANTGCWQGADANRIQLFWPSTGPKKSKFRPRQHPLLVVCWRALSLSFLALYRAKNVKFLSPPIPPVGRPFWPSTWPK